MTELVKNFLLPSQPVLVRRGVRGRGSGRSGYTGERMGSSLAQRLSPQSSEEGSLALRHGPQWTTAWVAVEPTIPQVPKTKMRWTLIPNAPVAPSFPKGAVDKGKHSPVLVSSGLMRPPPIPDPHGLQTSTQWCLCPGSGQSLRHLS